MMPQSGAIQMEKRSSANRKSRQHYSLAQKLMIVRESQTPGVSQAHVSKRHNLGKNVLWTWRKALVDLEPDLLRSDAGERDDLQQRLMERVAELERLLGQKTVEIEQLKNRLKGKM